MARALPSAIGRYRVERELGRGAMGVVYKALDPDIGRAVAIKLVRADLLDGEERETFVARFRREARAAGRCSHPNIVALYDFGMHDGNPFLAMEYIDGIGLGQALQRAGRFSPREAVSIVAQVLDALGAAHTLGIVHRDVKPANILLLPSGQAKVTDFGISRIDTSDITQDGSVIGTPAYMSPEQCRGDAVDGRGDLFSAGTVLYELLSGTRAFPGRNATEVTYQLLTVEPRDLAEFVADIPVSLGNTLRRSLAKERDARFATAEAMAVALRSAVAGPDMDRTAIVPPPEVFAPDVLAPSGGEVFDDATLDTEARSLARYMGPIARHLVREAARNSGSLARLRESLAEHIAEPAARRRFLDDATSSQTGTVVRAARTTAGTVTATAAGRDAPVPAAAEPVRIDRAERALTRFLGPIARLLVKRAQVGAGSEAALWDRLAAHIDVPADREAFSRQRPEG